MTQLEYSIIRCTLAIIWLVTGIISLGVYPVEESLLFLRKLQLDNTVAQGLVYSGAVLDLLIGVLIFLIPGRKLWLAQIIIIIFYSVFATFLVPELWFHPFGPLLKNIAILVLLWLLLNAEGVNDIDKESTRGSRDG